MSRKHSEILSTSLTSPRKKYQPKKDELAIFIYSKIVPIAYTRNIYILYPFSSQVPEVGIYFIGCLWLYVKHKSCLSELCHDYNCIKTIVPVMVGITRIREEKWMCLSVSQSCIISFFLSMPFPCYILYLIYFPT